MKHAGNIILRQILIPVLLWILVFGGFYYAWSLFAAEAQTRKTRYETCLAETAQADLLERKNGKDVKAALNAFRSIASGDQYTVVGDILQQFEKSVGSDYLRRTSFRKLPENVEFNMLPSVVSLEVEYDGTFRTIQQALLHLENLKPNAFLTSFLLADKEANPTLGYNQSYLSATARYIIFTIPEGAGKP